MTQTEMEAEITSLRAQLWRIDQERQAGAEHRLRIERVSRFTAVAFSAAAIALVIAGTIFLGRSNPIFPFALSLLMTSISLSLLAQALRSPSPVAAVDEQNG